MMLPKGRKMVFPLALAFVCMLFVLQSSCGGQEDAMLPIVDDEPKGNPMISTDISVTSSESLIVWQNGNDLMQQLDAALSYGYGSALENETLKSLSINADSTLATATIVFKAEVLNKYQDSNTSNNSVSIDLERQLPEGTAVVLKADGPGETYELITSVLAPGYNPIEVPDCNHESFGRHIDEIFDNELGIHVFRFHIHTEPDNDRCIRVDRQRNEIKTYNQSPDNLLGVQNETVIYKWKFKLPEGFQSSPNFTHLHQLKSVGETVTGTPMYTLTTRKGTPDRLELRYAESDTQVTLLRTDLAPFIGVWLEVTEVVTYGESGSYSIEITQISDNAVLFEYSDASVQNWQPGTEFVRPKWGIYRSLINAQDLRDESLLYADFSIEELD